MNAKKLVVGIVVGTIVASIVGIVIFDNLVAGFYAAHMGSATGVMRESQLVWAVTLGTAAYAALITLALGTQPDGTTIVGGARTGAIVGLLLWGTADFVLLGIMNIHTPLLAIVDSLLEAVRAGFTGAAIAVVVARL
jgi:hypothetical protein